MKLEAEKKVVPKQKYRIIKFLKPAIGLAASFAIIFMLVYWPLKTFVPSQVVEDKIQLNEDEMEYLNMIEGMDENSFYALLDEPTSSDELTDDDLIGYLSANISEYEIYNETAYN